MQHLLIDIIVRILSRMSTWSRARKRAIVFALDLSLLVLSIWIAFSLRVGQWELTTTPIRMMLAGGLALMVPIFWSAGVYNAIFRYAGVGMMRTLLPAFSVYTAAMSGVFMVYGFPGVPRTLGLLQPLTFFLLVVGSRIAARYFFIDLLDRGTNNGEVRRVLIYGAGRAGQQLASSIRSDPQMYTVGFIDDDKRLAGQRLDGDRVFASSNLEAIITERSVTDILLALPSVSRRRQREILQRLRKLQVEVKILPRARDIVGGQISLSDIRPVEIEDLLGREPVAPNEVLLGRTIVGRCVLVTGAGGSIGSELCRQIVAKGATKVVLYELSEFSLYSIERELAGILSKMGKELEVVPVLGSVTDPETLTSVFTTHVPQTVYHAAAYKHVPLVEANAVQGVRNNVLGTHELVKAAMAAKVRDFILISTDKAVRPTNVMGATKRVAEQVLQSYAAKGTDTRFSMVRFGNVLGSSGSVVPLFRSQIEAGGPITITDERITRYFMTIPEAANLVIQAGGLAKGGEVFVLDMGKPVKIINLAKTMIQLSGLKVRNEKNPAGDIEITEVGLRPGEKLYEELLIGNEAEATRHDRIKMAHEHFLPWKEFQALLSELETAGTTHDCIRVLKKLVTEFDHQPNSEEGQKKAVNSA